MKKSILALLVITLLTSCNSKKEEALILDLEKSYANTAEFSHDVSLMYLNLMERNYVIHPEKAKPYYDKIIKVHKIAQEFYNLSDEIIFDTISTDFPLDELKSKYNSAIDTFISYIDAGGLSYYKIIKNDYSLKPYYKSHTRHTAMMMQNDIAIYESKTIKIIYENTTCHSGIWYSPTYIEPDCKNSSSSYSFSLNNYWYQQQDIRDRKISIDTIIYNGNIIEKNVLVSPILKFAKVSFDSLDCGKYEIRGNIKLLKDFGYTPTEPFVHKFEIKDE